MTRQRQRSPRHWGPGDRGSITAFTAVVCLGLLAFTGLAVDCGQAIAAKTQALGQAEDAARAGAQALDLHALRQNATVTLDPNLARRDADTYLAAQGARGSASADRTQVTVHVTAQVPTTFLALIGVGVLSVSATSTARAATTAAAP
jgi:hypothetical protein